MFWHLWLALHLTHLAHCEVTSHVTALVTEPVGREGKALSVQSINDGHARIANEGEPKQQVNGIIQNPIEKKL